MALPASIDTSAPAGSDSPAQGDDQIRALKLFIADVFGIPTSPSSISVAAATVTTDGNFGVGASVSFGTSAVAVLGIKSGTAPTTSPADTTQVYSADVAAAAGKAGLHIRDEEGTVFAIGDNQISANAALAVGTTSSASMTLATNNVTRVTLDTGGNLGLGQTSFGTSAAKVLAIGAGTAPGSIPADAVQLWVADVAAGEASLFLWTEANGQLVLRRGPGPVDTFVGGRLNVNTTAVGNVGTGEDDLITYSLPANTLGKDGQGVHVTAWGTQAANGNTKVITGYFGATAIVTKSNTDNGNDWFSVLTIVRTGATAQEAGGVMVTDGAARSAGQANPAETLSSAVTIKFTGTGTSNNDIVCEGMIVEIIN